MEQETNTAPEPQIKKQNDIWEIIKFTLIALAIVIPVRLFVAQPFVVSGDSMVPTFEHHDYLIVDEISYHLGDPKRGDVIIFRFPKNPDRFFIKRTIGLPGETVVIKNGVITIINEESPEGFDLKEDFLDVTTDGVVNITLKDDEYFVMGDNRDESSDSRSWGPLPRKNIIGRAWARLLPFNALGILPGAIDLDADVQK